MGNPQMNENIGKRFPLFFTRYPHANHSWNLDSTQQIYCTNKNFFINFKHKM